MAPSPLGPPFCQGSQIRAQPPEILAEPLHIEHFRIKFASGPGPHLFVATCGRRDCGPDSSDLTPTSRRAPIVTLRFKPGS